MLLLSLAAHAASIASPGFLAGPDAGAATADPAAVWYNPAAVAGDEGVHLLIDGQLAFVDVTATATRNDGIDPDTGEAYTPMTANVAVPVALAGVTWKVVPKRLAVGLAVYDPFAGGGKFVDASGEPDVHASGRYHGIDVELASFAIHPAVAVTVVDGFHVGLGGAYVIDHIHALQAADPLGTEGVPPEQVGDVPPADPYSYDVLLQVDGTGGHFMWNAGLYFDKFKQLQLGASYTSGGTFHVAGDAEVDVPAALSTSSEASTVPGKADFSLKLPPIVRAYLRSQLNPTVTLGLGWDYELWNVCCGTADGDVHIGLTNLDGAQIGQDDGVSIDIAQDQYAPVRLWNASSFSANVGVQAAPRVWLGLKGAYNQNAVPSYAVSSANLDFENVGVQAAARVKLSQVVTLGLTYSHFFLFTRDVTDSAFNLGDGNDRFTPTLPYTSNTDGVYSGYVNNVGLRLTADWGGKPDAPRRRDSRPPGPPRPPR